MNVKYTLQSVCANCQGPATQTCGRCNLVWYCGEDCQKANYPTHKKLCISPYSKSDWQPKWSVERREPVFTNRGQHLSWGIDVIKYFWGTMPAYDIMQLSNNEGEGYEKGLSILVAASNDLRNIVKTIADLPFKYNKKLTVVVNDKDISITARNAIILLIALTTNDEDDAVDCILHIWYSAYLTQKHVNLIRARVYPLIQDVNQKIKDSGSDIVLTKTLSFGTRSLRLGLKKAEWYHLFKILVPGIGLSFERAQEKRTRITLAPERVDYREYRMYALPPYHRVCDAVFREEGILLPMGHSRQAYTVPNPTLFQDGMWRLGDNDSPLRSWSLFEVLDTKAGSSKNDLYGKLYCLVQSLFRQFHRRMARLDVEFEFYCTEVKNLSHVLGGRKFSRIETSNIADSPFLGISPTLQALAPMLQSPAENSRATLITLFVTAVNEVYDEMSRNTGNKDTRSMIDQEVDDTIEYLGKGGLGSGEKYDPRFVMMINASVIPRNGNMLFEKYMSSKDFGSLETSHNVKMKGSHTVIDKWPTRIKRLPDDEGAKEEFEVIMRSDHPGVARYVEWAKTK